MKLFVLILGMTISLTSLTQAATQKSHFSLTFDRTCPQTSNDKDENGNMLPESNVKLTSIWFEDINDEYPKISFADEKKILPDNRYRRFLVGESLATSHKGNVSLYFKNEEVIEDFRALIDEALDNQVESVVLSCALLTEDMRYSLDGQTAYRLSSVKLKRHEKEIEIKRIRLLGFKLNKSLKELIEKEDSQK
jgi:hypothetical protein